MTAEDLRAFEREVAQRERDICADIVEAHIPNPGVNDELRDVLQRLATIFRARL